MAAIRIRRGAALVAGAACALLLAACSGGRVQDADWPLHGRTEAGERYSPLAQINRETVSRLGLDWSFDLDTEAGQEATPIMVGGVLYTISAYDVVHALDARTGKQLWSYDPQVREAAARSCCGPVSRGVAVADGRVFVGALDGRLIALDAKTGKSVWEAQTLDRDFPPPVNYSITGAPRVVKGKVIIGNGGAEFGARGYVTAYDVATGAKKWRFYTVPGKPGEKDGEASDAALEKALPTWKGEWWRWGGGGTVWDAIAYDPELDLLYLGTGNGSPTNHGLRSDGEGDNLYLTSIVALRPDTGEYVWHYQETPAESWDYTATQNIIFATLEIGGKPRKVLMQAPKSGFFYILDRATGELLSAEAFATVTWASKVDMKTGRPVENPEARWYRNDKPVLIFPSSGGAHNWMPMAFSPDTGLVYIPAQDMGIPFAPGSDTETRVQPGVYNTGVAKGGAASAMDADQLKAIYGGMKGYLLAWDPVKGKAAWRAEQVAPFNGGVLATAGGLVFQGNAARKFAAYDAKDGTPLWEFDAQTGIVAPPITYALDGVQYIAVMAGWGGAWPMFGGQMSLKAKRATGPNRLLVFKLDGKAELPPLAKPTPAPLDPPADTASAAQVERGGGLFGRYCTRCHGIAAVSASMVPDLRHSGALASPEGFEAIVVGGALKANGMPSFEGIATKQDAAAIRAYLIHRANADKDAGRD